MRKRFKALAVVNNLDVVNMQRLVSPFNGKPVLITESGSLARGLRTPSGEASFEDMEGGRAEGGAGTADEPGSSASGVPFAADDFLELDINVRRWSYLARKGLHKLEPKFGVINVSVGFLIEGREDSEVRGKGAIRFDFIFNVENVGG